MSPRLLALLLVTFALFVGVGLFGGGAGRESETTGRGRELPIPGGRSVVMPAESDGEPERAEVEPEASPDRGIAGLLLSKDGNPVRGSVVLFCDRDGRTKEHHGRADGDGRFRFTVEESAGAVAIGMLPYRYEGGALIDPLPTERSELVLRRGPGGFLRIEVTDLGGAPVEKARITAYTLLGNGKRWELKMGADWRHPKVRPPLGSIPPPMGPFEVSVSARGYVSEVFGPYDPSQVGGALQVRLTPHPRLRGRVLRDGEPVADAKVVLERDLRGTEGLDLEPRSAHPHSKGLGSTSTDAEGRFDLAVVLPLRAVLRASGPSGAKSRPERLLVQSKSELSEVVLHLDQAAGRVVGRVIVPASVRPDDYAVSVHRGGVHFLERLLPSGEFVWESHPPGLSALSIVTVQKEFAESFGWEPGERSRDATGHGLYGNGGPPEWALREVDRYPLVVRPGETTEIVLDPRDPSTTRIDGRIELSRPGLPPAVGSASLLGEEAGREPMFGRAILRGDGSFELLSRVEGEYLLSTTVKLGDSWKGSLRILDRVTVNPSLNTYHLSVDLSSLRVLLPEEQRSWGVELLHRSPAGARVFATSAEGEPGELYFPNAPCGEVELFVDERGVRRVLGRCNIAAGRESVLDLRVSASQK